MKHWKELPSHKNFLPWLQAHLNCDFQGPESWEWFHNIVPEIIPAMSTGLLEQSPQRVLQRTESQQHPQAESHGQVKVKKKAPLLFRVDSAPLKITDYDPVLPPGKELHHWAFLARSVLGKGFCIDTSDRIKISRRKYVRSWVFRSVLIRRRKQNRKLDLFTAKWILQHFAVSRGKKKEVKVI